jgi:transcriptional regulator with XRE-family HTH domain
MTPFGARLRELRAERRITLSTMAADLRISAAYLSALEHGRRGKPTPGLVQQICGYFGLIWDDVEALKSLAGISRPKVTLDTSGLSPAATALANELAEAIRELPEDAAADLRRRLADWRGK